MSFVDAEIAVKTLGACIMSKNDFTGLLPGNFEDFRSVEFWDGFFKARFNKVCLGQQGP